MSRSGGQVALRPRLKKSQYRKYEPVRRSLLMTARHSALLRCEKIRHAAAQEADSLEARQGRHGFGFGRATGSLSIWEGMDSGGHENRKFIHLGLGCSGPFPLTHPPHGGFPPVTSRFPLLLAHRKPQASPGHGAGDAEDAGEAKGSERAEVRKERLGWGVFGVSGETRAELEQPPLQLRGCTARFGGASEIGGLLSAAVVEPI